MRRGRRLPTSRRARDQARLTTAAARPARPALVVRARLIGSRRLLARSAARGSATRQRESKAALTSNDGFSVVAPISVIVPSSTLGSSASCCALLKRWISSMNRTVRPLRRRVAWPRRSPRGPPSRRRRPRRARRNWTAGACGHQAGQRGLARPGRSPENQRGELPPAEHRAGASRRPTRSDWPTNSSSVRGRIRSARGESAPGA